MDSRQDDNKKLIEGLTIPYMDNTQKILADISISLARICDALEDMVYEEEVE